MKRLLLAVLLLALCAGRAPAETREDLYWRLHRERNAVTRYGAPPTAGTNEVDQAGGGGESGELGDLVITCDNFEIDAYSHVGPIDGTLRFTVPFETSQGWIGYVLEGQSAPTDPGGVMSQEYVIVDPATGGNLVMMFNYGCEFLSFQDLWTDHPSVQNYFGPYSGTFSVARVASGPAPVPVPTTVLPTVSRETVRGMLAPAPTGEPPELAGGDLWLDCLAIPEGNWLCECPIAGTTNTAWRAALCPSNILRAVVWRHAVGLAPTNLPVTLEHDPSRVIGRIERLFYEAGTGVVARISVTQSGYAWAISNHCTKPSPDTRCFTTGTNVAIRTDGWIHEHQDYIEARCVPRGEDMSSVTNVPAGVQAIVMAPVYLRGLSLVGTPLLPTYIEQRVPDHLRDVYPLRPPRQWDWRNGY